MKKRKSEVLRGDYKDLLKEISSLLEAGRRGVARSVNSIMSATYWHIGKRIVEHEQQGKKRAEYGKEVIRQLSLDLSTRFGRGFSKANLEYMRRFYSVWPIAQTLSGQSTYTLSKQQLAHGSQIIHKSSAQSLNTSLSFPLPWSHYVRLMAITKKEARDFYEQEALRGGWSIRQLERQIGSLFYERTLLSRKKVAMLKKGQKKITSDIVIPEEEIKDPYILEFLDLKDEYSENDIEIGLINRLEEFLLELGSDFTFVGRQKRLRIGDEWYRVDLLFFHRKLKCLVIIDLKLDKLTHADVGQMNLYLNYAREHWTNDDENPPVGLILCASKNTTLAKYALEGLNNKVMATEYKMALPDEKILIAEIERSRKQFEKLKK